MVHEIGSRDFLISDFINTKKPCRATSKMGESRNSRVSVRYIANNLNEMCTNQPFATWIGSLWRCLFKKSIMDRYNVRFRELGHEDSLFIYEYLHHCSSCIRIDFQGYVYKSTPGSLGSTHANNVNFEWCELAAKAARDCFSRFKITPDQVWYANMHRLYAVNCASFLTTGYHKDCSCPYSERIHRWRKMRHDDFWMECGRYGFITKLQEAIWHICKYRLFYIFDPLLLIATRLHDRH